jgi:hypothetical protein
MLGIFHVRDAIRMQNAECTKSAGILLVLRGLAGSKPEKKKAVKKS